MELIKTKSFELASISQGDKNSGKLALLLPGRLDTKDYVSFVSHLKYFADRGFYAVAFDPPGTWDSPGETDLFTTTSYIKAVNELIEYFGNRPTLLLGHSRGASVAILVAGSNPVVNAIIPIMANYGEPSAPTEEALKNGFQLSSRDIPPGSSKTEKQKIFKLSVNYWTDGKKYNPEEALKKCAVPKLLIYWN
jgi:pimeloyl-ACP methyl ester carboxylesterase